MFSTTLLRSGEDAAMEPNDEPPPERCELINPVFTAFGPAMFRRAEADSTPVMVVTLGQKEAALPLRALQREFLIDDASPDGRMLGLIAEALDYVTGLHLGDMLPAEVLTGQASWQPEERHRATAEARLRGQLLARLDPAAMPEAGEISVERMQEDSVLRGRVQSAFEQAASALEVAGAEDIVLLVTAVAEELGFIEALRERLLHPVARLCQRLARMGDGWRGNAERQTTMGQVRKLARTGLQQTAERFAEVDAQTGEVMSTLRNVDSQRSFIRSNRDWLYRSLRAWTPILASWERAGPALDDAAWARLNNTYQFLAPRYMTVQEWALVSGSRRSRRATLTGPVMRW
jgi:hypothetical protein